MDSEITKYISKRRLSILIRDDFLASEEISLDSGKRLRYTLLDKGTYMVKG